MKAMRVIFVLMLAVCFVACAGRSAKQETEKAPQAAVKNDQEKASPHKKETQDEELRRIVREADPIIENILLAMKENDHKKYIRDFNDAMLSAHHDKKQFKKTNKARKEKIGEHVAKNVWKIDREYQYYVIYYWVKFSKVQDPVTIRMTLGKEKKDGSLKVSFLQYKSPALGN